MEALLTAFIAAGLAEWGDKTQLLVIALAARYGKPGPILAGVAIAALGNSAIAAAGGLLVNGHVTIRAISLLLAIALLLAGVAAFIGRKTPALAQSVRGGALAGTALGFFLVEFGDKTQFVTFAISARFDSMALAAAGATAGIVAANAPAALLGPSLAAHVPLRAIRYGAGALFLLVGFIVAVGALRLV